jgi:CRISPR-associated protein Csx14
MPEHRIGIDPRNPGLFFACCGLFEIAELLKPGGMASFEDQGRVFCLDSEAELPPPKPEIDPKAASMDAPNNKIEPLVFRFSGSPFVLDWWLNNTRSDTSSLKMWAARQASRQLCHSLVKQSNPNPNLEKMFDQRVYDQSRFWLDARSGWNGLDFGYSPNDEQSKGRKSSTTYPWVEILAATGLQGFRPSVSKSRVCRYSVWLTPLPLVAARAAVGTPWLGVHQKTFKFRIESRGRLGTFTFSKELQK